MELQKNLKLCLHGTMAFSSLCLSGTVCGGKNVFMKSRRHSQMLTQGHFAISQINWDSAYHPDDIHF